MRMDAEIESRMRPFQEELDFLDSIPGTGQRTAQALLAGGTSIRLYRHVEAIRWYNSNRLSARESE